MTNLRSKCVSLLFINTRAYYVISICQSYGGEHCDAMCQYRDSWHADIVWLVRY